MGNKFCTCHESEKHGQTSVMCCNNCGLPDEDFWHKPPQAGAEMYGVLEKLQNSMMLNGGNTAQEKLDWLLKELSNSYHLIKKQ